jgi:hypothetical protein
MRYIAQEIRERESEEFYNQYAQKIIDHFKSKLTNPITSEVERYPEESEIVAMIEEYKEYDKSLNK